VRIGVFSDVHGHLVELKKTLALFKTLEVDEIVCAGDLIDKGTESGAVVDLMRERGILSKQKLSFWDIHTIQCVSMSGTK
jgi:predicted phosphodiesterase